MPARKSAKKKPASKSRSTPTDTDAAKTADSKPAKTKKGSVVAKDVNLGHVFALRPRVRRTFRQPDFLRARNLLEDESYESTADAARAVAEKALKLTHDGPQGGRGKKGKRGL
jgi:hypothetical protein